MAVFPAKGIELADGYTVQFPTLAEFFAPDTNKTVEFKDIPIALVDSGPKINEDSLSRVDSLARLAVKLQYAEGDNAVLYPFFEALANLAQDPTAIRVLHYGDSQIEGDRMTSLIRAKLQGRFGGSGPGLIPALQIAPSFSIDQEASENWVRYPGYGKRSEEVDHSRYGMLATFCRYSPVAIDSENTVPYEAWIRLKKSNRAYQQARQFDRIRVFYGYNRRAVNTKLLADGTFKAEDSLKANEQVNTFDWQFKQTPDEVTVFFSGFDSPDVYGFSLESTTGVVVDNIPMRGASGTVFGAIPWANLAQCLKPLNPRLFILQFGGNTVPYIKDRDHAFRYAKSFGRQIKLLKEMNPGSAVIVIGPADMSIKEKTAYVTHPQLENVRDALKHHSFENGAAYFDTYAAMGGRNSMPTWVAQDPPLAATDYIHFSPQGAKKVAETFYLALEEEYDKWRKGPRKSVEKAPEKKDEKVAKPDKKAEPKEGKEKKPS